MELKLTDKQARALDSLILAEQECNSPYITDEADQKEIDEVYNELRRLRCPTIDKDIDSKKKILFQNLSRINQDEVIVAYFKQFEYDGGTDAEHVIMLSNRLGMPCNEGDFIQHCQANKDEFAEICSGDVSDLIDVHQVSLSDREIDLLVLALGPMSKLNRTTLELVHTLQES